jgi:endonuclease/exonuclease/phosphatase family metal-dependent hydrolase
MTAKMTTPMVRAGVGVLTVALALSAAMSGGAAQARARKHHHASSAPQFRAVTPPNTFYPLTGTSRLRDQRSFNKRNHRGTDITTACGAGVRTAIPGTARVFTDPAWGGKSLVRVYSSTHGIVTQYGFLSRVTITDGQILQAGQWLGNLGSNPKTHACALYFQVNSFGRWVDPSVWLNYYVGRMAPVGNLFDTTGFTVASMNMLGASHTPSSRYPAYTVRTPKALGFLKSHGVDVAGVQEFEQRQSDLLLQDPTFRSFNGAFRGGKPDTRNAILWRNSTMEFISGETLPIKYFNGSTIQIPVVLLRQRSTGRTAYFMNTHNPASNVFGYGNQSSYRNYDIGVEKAKIVELRATGRPVIMTGDFNDRAAAFCPMTANKLTISPNSIPSMSCLYPKQSSIDWIFAAGQARFTSYSYDTSAKSARVTDHPVILARAHLQD